MTGIPIAPVNLGNGQVVQGGGAPDPLTTLLQAFLQGSGQGASSYQANADRAQRSSANSAQLAIQQQELALRIAQERTRQEEFKHKQVIAEQQGKATQIALEPIMQHLAATGGLAQMMPPQAQAPQAPFDPRGGAGQPLPAIQQTQGGGITPPPAALPADERLAAYLKTMDPEAATAFVDGPFRHIMSLRQQQMVGEKGQAIQTGDAVTTYVPGKGFWDGQANAGKGGWVPQIMRRLSQDQKDENAQNHALKQAQIEESRARTAAMTEYRTNVQANGLTKQFLGTTKAIREKGLVTMQALMNINDAMNAPNPADRKVLTGQAIASFVVAAEPRAPQLRYQMLMYFKKNIDPTFVGGISTMVNLLQKGQYRDDQYQGMIHHLQNVLTQSRSEYEKQRAGEIKRHPELLNRLPPADEFFTSDMPTYDDKPDLNKIFGGVTP